MDSRVQELVNRAHATLAEHTLDSVASNGRPDQSVSARARVHVLEIVPLKTTMLQFERHMIVECPGCHSRYDVTGRPPGTRARCRCGSVFLLP